MNMAKPSIPSSDGGAADDLIEELARLMAEGAQKKSSGAPAPGGAKIEAATTAAPASSPTPPTPSTPPVPLVPLSSASSSPVSANVKPGGQTASGFDFGFSSSRPDRSGAPAPEPQIPLERDIGERHYSQPVTGEKIEPMFAKNSAPAFGAPIPRPVEPKTGAAYDPIGEIIRAGSPADAGTGEGGRGDGDNDTGTGPGLEGPPDQGLLPTDGLPKADNLKKPDSFQKTDSFKVPPVFGLGGKVADPVSPVAPAARAAPRTPAAAAAAAQAPAGAQEGKSLGRSEALDEIENLIGNAVRVDFSPDSDAALDQTGDQQDVEAAPGDQGRVGAAGQAEAVVPPQPQTAQGGSIDSPEDAIMQAMAAAGSSAFAKEPGVGASASAALADIAGEQGQKRVSIAGDEAVAASDGAKTASGRSSRFLVPIGAGIVLIAAISGGYWVLNSGADNADAPVLVADGTPGKQEPQPDQQGNDGQSAVFSEIDGNTASGENERLVSRDQAGDLIGNEIRRVITSENTEAGLANRRVRTVTVRPDGTIISGETAAAGGEVLPVERPNVPELPAGALDPELSSTVVASLPAALAASEVPSPGSSASPLSLIAPVPQPRPASRAALVTTGAGQNVSTQPQSVADNGANNAANNAGAVDLITGMPVASGEQLPSGTPATTPATPVANPGAWVQMASRRSEAAATQSAAELQTRYASILGGGQLQVKRVDLGDRGVFYRVLLASSTLNEASTICGAVQSAGGDCFTRNN